MKKWKSGMRWLCSISAAACMALLLSGCQIGDKVIVVSKTPNSRQVFQIDRSICELKEAKVYLANYQNIYGTAYTIDLWQHDFGEPSLSDYVKDVTLEELTMVYCMNLLAEAENMTLSEAEQQKVEQAAEVYYDSLTREEIFYMGVSKADIEEYYTHYALAQKLYHALLDSVNEEVSDDEARVIEMMQIFVADKKNADIVEQKLLAGEDFAAVANNYNELSAIRVTVARDDLPKAVEEVAFRLDNDEISSKIETENGYYFIKCLNKYNMELTEENKANIVEKRQEAAFDDVYKEFIDTRESYLNLELWETLELEQEKEIQTDSFFSVFETYCGEI